MGPGIARGSTVFPTQTHVNASVSCRIALSKEVFSLMVSIMIIQLEVTKSNFFTEMAGALLGMV